MLERGNSKYEALCILIFWPFGRRKVTESDVTASNTLTFILSSAQRDGGCVAKTVATNQD